jgi:Tfp pilus assembly protein PilN
LKESRGTLTLQGTAMDNETVALFMTNLEKSDYISAVDLQSTRMRTVAEHRLNVSDFTLECKTYAFKDPSAAAPARTKK